MKSSRRSLPPIGWLAAFESVARTGSVTASAVDLDLTQGAVSRQIQKLEDFLGASLFTRDRKRLRLTPVGASYADAIREGLGQISNATTVLRKNPLGGALELAVLPAFGAHWLAPRLASFQAAHPGITVNFTTRLAPFDFSRNRFQAAVHFGRDDWPDVQSMHLMDENLTPVYATSLSEGRNLQPADLADLPLLHLESRPKAWRRWFFEFEITADARDGMVVDQFDALLQAAAAGLGVALIPDLLIRDAVVRYGLHAMPEAELSKSGAYYLVWPDNVEAYPPLAAFRAWLASEVTKVG